MEKNLKDLFFFLSPKKFLKNETAFFYRETALLLELDFCFEDAVDIAGKEKTDKTFSSFFNQFKQDLNSLKQEKDISKKYLNLYNEAFLYILTKDYDKKKKITLLEETADEIENKSELKSKLKGIGFYPGFALFFLFFISLFILQFVIPAFSKMFELFYENLPIPTKNLIDISYFINNNFLVILIFIIAVFLLFAVNKRKITGLGFYLPFTNHAVKAVSCYELARYLKYLFYEDTPVTKAYRYSINGVSNFYVNKKLSKKVSEISPDDTLFEVLKNTKIFKESILSPAKYIKTSEQAYKYLDTIFKHYEKKSSILLNNLTQKFNLAVIIITGIIIGYFVIAMYLPLFKMSALIS